MADRPRGEKGSRTPADDYTAGLNLMEIARGFPSGKQMDINAALREELRQKGLKGFKKGGKVKKTGLAKVHKGERVLTAKQAAKPAVKRAVARGRKR
jgi:hypothetical protein